MPPLLQAQDTAGRSGGGALCALRAEVPVEFPLLPGSLSLSEGLKLQIHSDEQLEEGHSAQQPVAASDDPVITALSHHTQIADTSRPFRQVIERATDVEKSHMEPVHESQTLPEGKHGRQARSPLGLRQQSHGPLRMSPQPRLQAPRPGRRLTPTDSHVALLPTFQLILQAHKDLVQEVREEDVTEDKETPSGPRGNLTFGGIHLDDANIFLAKGLVT